MIQPQCLITISGGLVFARGTCTVYAEPHTDSINFVTTVVKWRLRSCRQKKYSGNLGQVGDRFVLVCGCLNHPESRKRYRDYSAATCESSGYFTRPKFFLTTRLDDVIQDI